ncbi:2-C-methyl-D-erythritol 2,4-cyclodiphosphate synthase [Isoalcanivorax pacificus W11-5]|uniref:2-C-methyl-D-erythritol 2,4-cyclodiphosphate synthase n=1 Tax=Isoalcanivorax pacificus W11-5 TaxID=391936 RepID=A0A0B4XRC9_9GAMM|nr:2-C-methyl-D-erythritol 2,4-cyclodiphosphate synthase [Isoalcanivorax pacificus W11-5]
MHAFTAGDHVMLGGVRIPHSHGLKAHSDGDVALHALADALLGALALGDIGHFFPDTDPAWRGADSAVLLQKVYEHITAAGYQLGNADITVIAQKPKMAPHIGAMRARIAALLDADAGQISVKATTTEHLGFTGREEGIAVTAVVLLEARA